VELFKKDELYSTDMQSSCQPETFEGEQTSKFCLQLLGLHDMTVTSDTVHLSIRESESKIKGEYFYFYFYISECHYPKQGQVENCLKSV
jgi:hypothetical protein